MLPLNEILLTGLNKVYLFLPGAIETTAILTYDFILLTTDSSTLFDLQTWWY